MEVRRLAEADRGALQAFLDEDALNNVYLLSILSWFDVAGSRARFWGAFLGGALAGVVAEGREVHCWFASIAVSRPEIVRTLAPVLAAPRAEVLLGREDVVDAALGVLPAGRVGEVRRMVLSRDTGETALPSATHPWRLATNADLHALVRLYEGYEFDAYPTRRHVYRMLIDEPAAPRWEGSQSA